MYGSEPGECGVCLRVGVGGGRAPARAGLAAAVSGIGGACIVIIIRQIIVMITIWLLLRAGGGGVGHRPHHGQDALPRGQGAPRARAFRPLLINAKAVVVAVPLKT